MNHKAALRPSGPQTLPPGYTLSHTRDSGALIQSHVHMSTRAHVLFVSYRTGISPIHGTASMAAPAPVTYVMSLVLS